ncbi:MAG: ankyrin repeat domain-containing protein, partial [Alphaproteobacteria bacterium]|nr:ankyrin repeat domain-containing protein [Alphaproteobacteria bacterium]
MRFLILIIAIFELSDVFAKSEIDAKLVKFIEENKQTELRNYLKKKIPINVKNAALRLAVEKNRVKIARALIDNGANINVQDEKGITPLMIATLRNYPSMVRMLLISNANERIKDKNGDTALIHSIRSNYMECFTILLNTYPEIDELELKGEALFIAIKLGRIEMATRLAKYLVQHNRYNQLNRSYDGKVTSLALAISKGYLDIVKLLIEGVADVNSDKGDDDTPLIMYASKHGQIDIAKLLIEKGADVNATNSCGYTALMEACSRGHFDIAKLLIENGADVNAKDMGSFTALMYALGKERDCIELMKLLIENGADTEVENKLTRTVLLQASIECKSDIVKFFIKNGS